MSKTPKLRFKEFSGDWEEKKLGSISIKVGSGKTPKGGNSVYTDSGVVFIRSQNVLNGKLNLDEVAYISEEINSTMKSTEVYGDDILLNITGASIGRSCVVPKIFPKANVNQHVCIIRLNENYNSNFIVNQIISSKVQRQIDSYQAGGNREGLNFEQIKGMKVSSTTLEEQEKIASFFSLIDDKISLQSEKLEMLKDYKKGMMQKIFSRELRFKDDDGRDYPEWEEKKLGDIADIVMGQSPSSSCYNEEYEGLPLIQGNADIKDRRTSPRLYTSEITKTCDIGDIIMSVRAPVGAISISLHNACIGRGVCSIKPKYNLEYIYQFLLKYESKWSQVSQGSTFESVSSNDIKSLKVPYPNLAEQKKIGSLLRNMDEKIEKEQEKLNSLNEYKKGLLQQMFI